MTETITCDTSQAVKMRQGRQMCERDGTIACPTSVRVCPRKCVTLSPAVTSRRRTPEADSGAARRNRMSPQCAISQRL